MSAQNAAVIFSTLFSREWQRCRVSYSHQLQLSTEHHARFRINAPGWGKNIRKKQSTGN